MNWTMQTKLSEIALNNNNAAVKNAAVVLGYEFARLVK